MTAREVVAREEREDRAARPDQYRRDHAAPPNRSATNVAGLPQ
jgi:hypothetical protein